MLADWFYRRAAIELKAQALLGETEADETALPPAPLPYTQEMSVELWLAYQNGITAVAGGYLDQPRKWRRLIRMMNTHYHAVYAQVKEEWALVRPMLDEGSL